VSFQPRLKAFFAATTDDERRAALYGSIDMNEGHYGAVVFARVAAHVANGRLSTMRAALFATYVSSPTSTAATTLGVPLSDVAELLDRIATFVMLEESRRPASMVIPLDEWPITGP
jgi:hypothetical protein